METDPVVSTERFEIRKGFRDYADSITYTQNEIGIDGLFSINLHEQNMRPFSILAHYHPNRFEFHYVMRGIVKFSVNEKEYTAIGNQVFFTFPNEVHYIPESPVTGHTFYILQIEVKDSILQMDEKNTRLLFDKLFNLKNRVINVNPLMKRVIKDAFECAYFPDDYQRQTISTQIAYFLQQLIEMDKNEKSESVSPDIETIINYMSDHIFERFDMRELAEYVGLSYSHFNYKFKKEIGVTPADYFTKLQIDKAKQMLLEGCSITYTALELDFSTANYFSTVFHRVTGLSPTQWINNNKLPE